MSSKAAPSTPALACPCGSGAAYGECCGPLHAGAPAATAEALMRARYCAYVMGDDAFIASSWHATTRPPLAEPGRDASPQAHIRWLGLDIRRHEAAGDTATVEFIARFKSGGRAERLHEISRFVRDDGVWRYVDGSFPATEMPRVAAGSKIDYKAATIAAAKAEKQ
ncbi:MAG: SEC-C domain-containing protein [Herminiimonas sp.]|nr:SEC-C domain-containing protein [Herminiimonas sp.]